MVGDEGFLRKEQRNQKSVFKGGVVGEKSKKAKKQASMTESESTS